MENGAEAILCYKTSYLCEEFSGAESRAKALTSNQQIV